MDENLVTIRTAKATQLSSGTLAAAQGRFLSRADAADRAAADHEAQLAADEAKQAKATHAAARRALWRDWGARYEACTLENYRPKTQKQAEALETIRDYGDKVHYCLGQGIGIILTGPWGTGKDHLLAGLAKVALDAGFAPRWTSGLRFFERVRDDIGADASEAARTRAYTDPPILIISDPTWQRVPLTTHEARTLGRVIDDRHNNFRPTWISINAKPGDAERLLGGPMLDRLKANATSLLVDGPSGRKTIESLDDIGKPR